MNSQTHNWEIVNWDTYEGKVVGVLNAKLPYPLGKNVWILVVDLGEDQMSGNLNEKKELTLKLSVVSTSVKELV